jgi:hypothetical protein
VFRQQRADPFLFGAQDGFDPRVEALYRPARQYPATAAGSGQEHRAIVGEGRDPVGRIEKGAEPRGLAHIAHTALRQLIGGPALGGDRKHGFGTARRQHVARRHPRRNMQQRANRRGQVVRAAVPGAGTGQRAALGDQFVHQRPEFRLFRRLGHEGQRPAQRRIRPRGARGVQHPRPPGGEQRGGAAFVEHGEMRRHPRLHREAFQQPFAEGMDGLDLEAAGNVQGAREQPSRRGPLRRAAAMAECDELRLQRHVGQCRPAAKPVEHPLLHLGRRGAGEGQA